jgi:hypothetical protein
MSNPIDDLKWGLKQLANEIGWFFAAFIGLTLVLWGIVAFIWISMTLASLLPF